MKEDQKWNASALSMLHMAIVDWIFPRIKRAAKPKDAWEILHQEYIGDNSKVRVAELPSFRKEFENNKMKEKESINYYSFKFTDFVN